MTRTGRSSALPDTPGHLSLWHPDERLLAVGDALSDYDIGWVNIALDGPDAATTALASLHRLAELTPRVLLQRPVPTTTGQPGPAGPADRRATASITAPS